ncbi:MAG: ABC transporter substrate-binding protein [Patescibacteria group bacterium]|nr:ABC transporter substrate-binding protein [Patescibacteria group bacterium]
MEKEKLAKYRITKKQVYACVVFVCAIILVLLISFLKELPSTKTIKTPIDKLGIQQGDKLGIRQGDFIKIGAILPLTGNQSSYGVVMKNVLEIAFKEINAQGGARGHEFELVVENGKCNSGDAESAMEKLAKENKAQAVIGGFCDEETLGALPVAEKYKIALISGATKSSPSFQQNLFFATIFPNRSFSPNYKNEKFQNLSRLYKEQYKKELPYPTYAGIMYDAAFMTRDAIIGAGLGGEKIAKWFRGVVEWPGASGLVTISEKGERIGL